LQTVIRMTDSKFGNSSWPDVVRQVCYFSTNRCTAMLRVGLIVLAACVTWAPTFRASAFSGASSLSISAASTASPSCGATISAVGLQQDLETQLRARDIFVSRVHTASLVTDIDCISRNSARQRATLEVRQCLALSQLASSRSQAIGVTFVKTWQKCDSYTCTTRKCGTTARSRLRSLASAFLADFDATGSASDSVDTAQPAPQRLRIEREVHRDASSGGTIYRIAPELVIVYYLLYLATCCAVMLRWLRQQQFR